jgi:methanogenic corrinoid protein MtbC1
MSGDLLEGAGYRVTFVGADPPRTALLEAAEHDRPAAIVLGSLPSLCAATALDIAQQTVSSAGRRARRVRR